MESEKISVIIPIYNVEKYLKKCIDSVLSQDYKNLEIMLVDDESPDECGKICDEYAKKDERIKVIHKENGGLSDARNAGIKMATGTYIGFIDSDDYIEKDMYRILYENAKKYDADISICKYRKVYEYRENLLNEKKRNEKNSIEVFETTEEKMKALLIGTKITDQAMTKLYKKEIFKGIKFKVGYKFEDIDIMYKLFEKSNKIIYTNYLGYNYLQRNGSIIKTMDEKSTLDLLEAVNARYDYIDEKNFLDELNKARRCQFIFRYHVILARIKSNKYDSEIMLKEYEFFKKYYKRTRKNVNTKLYEKILIQVLLKNRYIFKKIIEIIYDFVKRGKK